MSDISTKLIYLNQIKQLIRQAIIEREVEVSDADTFKSYADKILQIPNKSIDIIYIEDTETIQFIDNRPPLTLTINPTPSNATVNIVSGTCIQYNNSIDVPLNSVVEYTVSADGYSSVSNKIILSENTNLDIQLQLLPITVTINNISNKDTSILTYNDGSGQSNSVKLNGGASTTINVIPNTPITAVNSYGSYLIFSNTNGSIDYKPYQNEYEYVGEPVEYYISININTVNTNDNIYLVYSDDISVNGIGNINIDTDTFYSFSTPLSITTTGSSRQYVLNYRPTPVFDYDIGGVFALIDTNGIGSTIL